MQQIHRLNKNKEQERRYFFTLLISPGKQSNHNIFQTKARADLTRGIDSVAEDQKIWNTYCYYYSTAQNMNLQHTRWIDASIPERRIWELAANKGLFHRTNRREHPGELGSPHQQRKKPVQARMDLRRTPARGSGARTTTRGGGEAALQRKGAWSPGSERRRVRRGEPIRVGLGKEGRVVRGLDWWVIGPWAWLDRTDYRRSPARGGNASTSLPSSWALV